MHIWRLCRMVALVSCLAVSALASDDEVKFRARRFRSRRSAEFKSYEPSKAQRIKTFQAKPYAGKMLGASRTKYYQERVYESRTRNGVPDLPVYVGKMQDEKLFKQQKEIVVRSIPADPRKMKERKPFVSGVGKQKEKTFVAKEKSKARNPLLKPRQGIKEYAPDAE